jgi:hypothetical protein
MNIFNIYTYIAPRVSSIHLTIRPRHVAKQGSHSSQVQIQSSSLESLVAIVVGS